MQYELTYYAISAFHTPQEGTEKRLLGAYAF